MGIGETIQSMREVVDNWPLKQLRGKIDMQIRRCVDYQGSLLPDARLKAGEVEKLIFLLEKFLDKQRLSPAKLKAVIEDLLKNGIEADIVKRGHLVSHGYDHLLDEGEREWGKFRYIGSGIRTRDQSRLFWFVVEAPPRSSMPLPDILLSSGKTVPRKKGERRFEVCNVDAQGGLEWRGRAYASAEEVQDWAKEVRLDTRDWKKLVGRTTGRTSPIDDIDIPRTLESEGMPHVTDVSDVPMSA